MASFTIKPQAYFLGALMPKSADVFCLHYLLLLQRTKHTIFKLRHQVPSRVMFTVDPLENILKVCHQISFPSVDRLEGFCVARIEDDKSTHGTLVVSSSHVAKSLLKHYVKI